MSEAGEEESAAAAAPEGEEGEKEEATEIAPPKKEALRNQFNFSERASQTFNNPYRVSQTHLYGNLSVFAFLHCVLSTTNNNKRILLHPEEANQ